MTTPQAPTRVAVRMYRALIKERGFKGLLGDCFLIRLQRGRERSHILIDCGILLGSTDAEQRMAMIAADIVKTTGGRLDLLVVTHEHWDHISGFSLASNVFFDPSKLRIDNVWMAWTENPQDEQAKALRARFDKSGAAFAMMAQRLDAESARFGADAGQRALGGLTGFMGLAAAGGGRLAGRDIMEKFKDPQISRATFLEPGTVLFSPGSVGLRSFVLGPPRDEKLLFKDAPSKGQAQETYLDAPTADGALMLQFAAGAEPDPSKASPFGRQYCHLTEKVVRDHDGSDASVAWLKASYYGRRSWSKGEAEYAERRRIDGDWLGAAGPLALKLDSDTNNTSLVLAFELPDNSVMLFAADAQVGNWLSWHEQDYTDETGRKLTAAELLGRTRFYKVGHHGSHNATLEEKGLALMTRDDLVAAIPTDEEFGKKQGSKGWHMPNPRVKTALLDHTNGRIMRNDRLYTPEARQADPELQDVEPAFFDRLTEQDLYLEYRLI